MSNDGKLPGDQAARLQQHILPTAGTMLGICTTLIGLVKVLEGTKALASRVDEFGGIVGAMFLFSALASYGSIRTERRAALSRRLETAADGCFLLGLLSLALLSLIFAYELL
ncbi:hypothetical protein [uncultured Enterovirga sp.]|uniref:hypothetical protein n=1 Tax=uncultured Enterovirga sp. TaxID=2026352 RepID=UPI0035CAFFD6